VYNPEYEVDLKGNGITGLFARVEPLLGSDRIASRKFFLLVVKDNTF
jgi:hypothetical protein